jgi:hypothetical protein
MPERLMLALLLLLSSAWLQAQQSYPSPDEGKAPSAPAGMTVLAGCLQYDDRQYWLMEADGTKHLLAGAGKQLKGYVGHQVELTGKPSSRSIDNTPPGGASNVITQYVFEVKSVRHIALTCKTQ